MGRDEEIWLKAEQELREEHRVPDTASTPASETVPTHETRAKKSSTKAPHRRSHEFEESSSKGTVHEGLVH